MCVAGSFVDSCTGWEVSDEASEGAKDDGSVDTCGLPKELEVDGAELPLRVLAEGEADANIGLGLGCCGVCAVCGIRGGVCGDGEGCGCWT